jgi:hypothetical protein
MICIYGERLQTLVNDIVGNDTPTKKPKTTPTMAAIMSFIRFFNISTAGQKINLLYYLHAKFFDTSIFK